MLWDLYLVSENPSLRIQPRTAVHMLRTLFTDGRIASLSEQEAPRGDDNADHVRFTATPGDNAHSIFYDGPKFFPEAPFSRFEVEILGAPEPVPGALAEEDAPDAYWFWLRLVDARFNFVSANFSERLENALRMKATVIGFPVV